MSNKIKIGISIGDINGIGLEVILKTLSHNSILDYCTPIVYGHTKVASYHRKALGLTDFAFNVINDPSTANIKKANLINCWEEDVKIDLGVSNETGGKYALLSLQKATDALIKGEIDALVTAPINKHNIQSEAFNFPGHTDYLAKELEGESLMFMVSDTLRIGLLTDHVPLKDIVEHITSNLIEKKINTVYNSLIKDFNIIRPKIAVLGINPHTGDNGVIGHEDDTVMRPTLNKLKEAGKLVFGPYAADSFFGSNNYKNFDAIIASYHDQGLIPFKTLSFGQGVNYTAGLNKVRTSPDHGTAYEIAGKGIADENSFKEAVFAAIKIFKNRLQYKELTSNPLKKGERKEYDH